MFQCAILAFPRSPFRKVAVPTLALSQPTVALSGRPRFYAQAPRLRQIPKVFPPWATYFLCPADQQPSADRLPSSHPSNPRGGVTLVVAHSTTATRTSLQCNSSRPMESTDDGDNRAAPAPLPPCPCRHSLCTLPLDPTPQCHPPAATAVHRQQAMRSVRVWVCSILVRQLREGERGRRERPGRAGQAVRQLRLR